MESPAPKVSASSASPRFSRKLLILTLFVLDILLVAGDATESFHLKEVNLTVQDFLYRLSPVAVLTAINSAEERCWVARSFYDHKKNRSPVYGGCDGDGRQDELEQTLNSTKYGTLSPQEMQNTRAKLCREEAVGCRDYSPAFPEWGHQQIAVAFNVLGNIWGKYFLIVWLIGFIFLVRKNVIFALMLGVFVGTFIILPIFWTLYILTIALGYVIGFVTWVNGISVIYWALLVRKAWKLPGDVKEAAKKL